MTAAGKITSEDAIARRNSLAMRANPKPNRDYVVTLHGSVEIGSMQSVAVRIRYVPDRLICDAALTAEYFGLINQQAWPGIEELAHTILDDFNNELIPRWISVNIAAGGGVYVEDRQPLWDNVNLLHRSQ